jgi:hypothetical protein
MNGFDDCRCGREPRVDLHTTITTLRAKIADLERDRDRLASAVNGAYFWLQGYPKNWCKEGVGRAKGYLEAAIDSAINETGG